MKKDLAAWLDQTNTQCDGGLCILLKDSKEWHESWKWIVTEIDEYPIDWDDMHTSAMFKGNDKQLPLFAKWFPSHFPHHDRWVPLFGFTSSKRVTNTHYISSEEKSKLICFMNLREEGFIPKMGLSMFNLMSPLKENSVSFMFREFERIWKKTRKGVLFHMI